MKSGSDSPMTFASLFLAAVVPVCLVNICGCDEKPTTAAKPPPPASSSHPVKESDLNVLTLTPDAERRLDVKTSPVRRKRVSRARLFGGEVVVPPGRSVVVSAPLAGTVTTPDGKPVPAGQPLEKGQALFTLQPLLTSEARTTLATALVDAEGQVRSAEVNLKAAEVALNRAKQLSSEGAGTRRATDEAQADFELAQKAAEAARARREVLEAATKEGGGGSVEPLTLASPESGVLRNVHAAPGQMVSAGAPLFEVMNPARVWVRVAVYAGDVTEVDDERPAKVGRLSGRTGGGAAQALEAKPVPAPPSADPRISTVDLFYELDNEKGQVNPGQRVGVTVPLRGDEESLVVPWSAVVYDATGGAWVYEKLREHAYARRRVSLRHVVNGDAVLDAGPAAGTQVVTQGVAEMFGNEMGFAK